MSEQDSTDDDRIEVRHTYSDKYELHPATGVAGGVQPQGDIKIDSVYDHDYRTKSEYYDPETGQYNGLSIDAHMEREHRTGVTMSPQSAYHAAVFLLTNLTGEEVTREEVINQVQQLGDPDEDTNESE